MTSNKEPTLPKVLIPEVKLRERVREMAQKINYDYRDQEVTLICVLKGTFVFFSDLIRELEIPVTCEFLGLSSYSGQMVTSGEVKVTLDITEPLRGKHVIVVEDIVDSGLTLQYILTMLRSRGPVSVRCAALLLKPDSLKTKVEVDYLGFKIGNEFVVGYGVDYREKFRGLPYIGYLESGH